MLKIKSILVSLLAVAALASCSNENLEENPEVEGGAGYDVAYVSISLTNPKVPGSRASGEQTALEEESAINEDRKSTRLNSSHSGQSRMPSSA